VALDLVGVVAAEAADVVVAVVAVVTVEAVHHVVVAVDVAAVGAFAAVEAAVEAAVDVGAVEILLFWLDAERPVHREVCFAQPLNEIKRLFTCIIKAKSVKIKLTILAHLMARRFCSSSIQARSLLLLVLLL
jgi:hypothetical protein